MEKIARRSFCGTALLAFPLLSLCGKNKDKDDRVDQSDSLMDILADEFTRATADGSQSGFRAEHYRQYASHIRIFDALLESKGMNADMNKRLDDDDFNQLNPARMAKTTVEYWKKHGIIFDENDLAVRLAIDWTAYRGTKKAIKQQGGVRTLHASIAEAFERKAREQGAAAYRGGPRLNNGRITFPALSDTSRPSKFMTVQYDLRTVLGANLDCLCRAMIVEGSLLALSCLAGILPLCEAGAFLLAFEKLMEGLQLCQPSRC